MAGPTLPVLTHPFFPQVFAQAIDQHFTRVERLGLCSYEDEHCDCREVATVHPLDPALDDFEFCLRHFEKVTRG